MKNWLQLYSENLNQTVAPIKEGHLSLYRPDVIDKKFLLGQLMRVQKAFPSLSTDFFEELSDRILFNQFSKERLIDAINNLIDNYQYPTPTIASIVGYDRKVKTYSYYEMSDYVTSSGIRQNDLFVGIDNGSPKPVYIKKNDYLANKHAFKIWKGLKDERI